MSNQVLNTFKKMLLEGDIVGAADTFKIILMQTGFVFDQTTHTSYSAVSGNELATAYGYTAGGYTLLNVAVSVDQTSGLGKIAWSNAQWNASGGALVSSGAIIYDDTTSTGSGHDITKAVVAYIDSGSLMIASDGTPFIIKDVYVTIT